MCKREILLSFLIIICFISELFGYEVGVVTQKQRGQGLTRRKGSECFIITVRHLTDHANTFQVIADQGYKYPATLVRTYEEIGLLSMGKGTSDRICGNEVWTSNLDQGYLEARLGSNIKVVLRNEDGSISSIKGILTDLNDRNLIAQFTQETNPSKGMSGGTIYLGDIRIGMVNQIIKMGGKSKVNKILGLRIDYVGDLTRSFFDYLTAAKDRINTSYVLDRQSPHYHQLHDIWKLRNELLNEMNKSNEFRANNPEKRIPYKMLNGIDIKNRVGFACYDILEIVEKRFPDEHEYYLRLSRLTSDLENEFENIFVNHLQNVDFDRRNTPTSQVDIDIWFRKLDSIAKKIKTDLERNDYSQNDWRRFDPERIDDEMSYGNYDGDLGDCLYVTGYGFPFHRCPDGKNYR